MMRTNSQFLMLILLFACVRPSDLPAQVLEFEEFAPFGGLLNVSPTVPYTESGFSLTPTSGQSAVFDSAATAIFFGGTSDWFGFAETNTITITENNGLLFDLDSISLGRSDLGTPDPVSVDVTLLGLLSDGTEIEVTYPSLVVLTTFQPAWTDLTSVTITSTDDTGVDDIVVRRIDVTNVPEPSSSVFLCILAVFGLAHKRRMM